MHKFSLGKNHLITMVVATDYCISSKLFTLCYNLSHLLFMSYLNLSLTEIPVFYSFILITFYHFTSFLFTSFQFTSFHFIYIIIFLSYLLNSIYIYLRDGSNRTGAFLAISITLDRFKATQIIDVFGTTQKLRSIRPQFMENMVSMHMLSSFYTCVFSNCLVVFLSASIHLNSIMVYLYNKMELCIRETFQSYLLLYS